MCFSFFDPSTRASARFSESGVIRTQRTLGRFECDCCALMAVSQDVRDWLSSQPPSVVLDRDMSKRANLAHALSDGSVVAAIIEARYPLLLHGGPGVRAGVESTLEKRANWDVLARSRVGALDRLGVRLTEASATRSRRRGADVAIDLVRKLRMRMEDFAPQYEELVARAPAGGRGRGWGAFGAPLRADASPRGADARPRAAARGGRGAARPAELPARALRRPAADRDLGGDRPRLVRGRAPGAQRRAAAVGPRSAASAARRRRSARRRSRAARSAASARLRPHARARRGRAVDDETSKERPRPHLGPGAYDTARGVRSRAARRPAALRGQARGRPRRRDAPRTGVAPSLRALRAGETVALASAGGARRGSSAATGAAARVLSEVYQRLSLCGHVDQQHARLDEIARLDRLRRRRRKRREENRRSSARTRARAAHARRRRGRRRHRAELADIAAHMADIEERAASCSSSTPRCRRPMSSTEYLDGERDEPSDRRRGGGDGGGGDDDEEEGEEEEEQLHRRRRRRAHRRRCRLPGVFRPTSMRRCRSRRVSRPTAGRRRSADAAAALRPRAAATTRPAAAARHVASLVRCEQWLALLYERRDGRVALARAAERRD